jgi:hypothetical protein
MKRDEGEEERAATTCPDCGKKVTVGSVRSHIHDCGKYVPTYINNVNRCMDLLQPNYLHVPSITPSSSTLRWTSSRTTSCARSGRTTSMATISKARHSDRLVTNRNGKMITRSRSQFRHFLKSLKNPGNVQTSSRRW